MYYHKSSSTIFQTFPGVRTKVHLLARSHKKIPSCGLIKIAKVKTLYMQYKHILRRYWVGQKVHLVFSIKYTFFIFTITLLIWIFWLCQLSPTWHNTDRSQLMSLFDCSQLPLVYPSVEHLTARNLQQKTSQTAVDTFDQSQHLLHTLHRSLLFIFAFQQILSFLKSQSIICQQ